MDGVGPLVFDEDVVQFARRDAEQAAAVMPAVDYRPSGGLSWEELETVIGRAVDSGGVRGLEVTIFNPALDSDGSIDRRLISCLRRGLVRGYSVP